jgi:hypothetical protein
MGRKKTPGNRSAGGRKKKPSTNALRAKWDYGNDYVRERRTRFEHPKIKQGKAGDHVFDAIGQLWAMDLLDGHGFDGTLLRDAGREYAGLYFYTYVALTPKGGLLERSYGGKPDLSTTARDMRFAKLDGLLPFGSDERRWAHALVIDCFGMDQPPAWVERLVNWRRHEIGLPVSGDLAMPEDSQRLNHALRGLLALVDGCLPERYARAA